MLKKSVNYTIEISSVAEKRMLLTNKPDVIIRPLNMGVYFVFIQIQPEERITSIKLLKILIKKSQICRELHYLRLFTFLFFYFCK